MQARQLVRHRHVEVNGRTVDVPSFHVSPGDEISRQAEVQGPGDGRRRASRPGRVRRCWTGLPWTRRAGWVAWSAGRRGQDIPLAAQEQLIVELYSK